jgi:4-hydroxy-tetrahydrodipicolinate reductase
MIVTGSRGGQPLLRMRTNWYCSTELEPAWELGDTGWRVQVEGDLPLDVRITFPVPAERWGETSPGVTAHRPVNAIRYVCEAAPGIATSADLPQIIANLSGSAA